MLNREGFKGYMCWAGRASRATCVEQGGLQGLHVLNREGFKGYMC